MTEHPFKVCIVGNHFVGKTSLVNAFRKQNSPNPPPQTTVPEPSSLEVVTVLEQTVPLQLWDTAGAEQYQDMNPFFTRDSHIGIVCYLPGESDTVRRWKTNVETASPDARFVGAVMKMDAIENDPEAIERATAELRETVERDGLIGGYLTSSMEGSIYFDQIEKLFGAIADEVTNPGNRVFTTHADPGLKISVIEPSSPRCC